MALGSALYVAEAFHFLSCIFKALQSFYHWALAHEVGLWLRWVCYFNHFTAGLYKVTSVSP